MNIDQRDRIVFTRTEWQLLMELHRSVSQSEFDHSQHVSTHQLPKVIADVLQQVREASQLTAVPEGPLFLGDGSLAGAPAPSLKSKGIRPVLKVVDDKCL